MFNPDHSPPPEGWVPNPIADYTVKWVSPENAAQAAPLAPLYVLFWRAAACLCALNWAGCDQVMAEAELDGRAFDLFKIAVAEAVKIAVQAAEGDHSLAEQHFLVLIQGQHRIAEESSR